MAHRKCDGGSHCVPHCSLSTLAFLINEDCLALWAISSRTWPLLASAFSCFSEISRDFSTDWWAYLSLWSMATFLAFSIWLLALWAVSSTKAWRFSLPRLTFLIDSYRLLSLCWCLACLLSLAMSSLAATILAASILRLMASCLSRRAVSSFVSIFSPFLLTSESRDSWALLSFSDSFLAFSRTARRISLLSSSAAPSLESTFSPFLLTTRVLVSLAWSIFSWAFLALWRT